MFNFKGKEVKNVKFTDKKGVTHQLEKLSNHGVVVWENWKPWSYDERRPSSGYSNEYVNDYYSNTVNVSDKKIAFISAWGHCETSGSEYYCDITIQAYYKGGWHDLAKGGTGINNSYTSWKNTNNIHIEKIRAKKGGLALRSSVELHIEGFKKGSSSRATPMMMAAPQTLEEPTQEEKERVVIKL